MPEDVGHLLDLGEHEYRNTVVADELKDVLKARTARDAAHVEVAGD